LKQKIRLLRSSKDNEKKFYSNGKLLITGEYLVLDGKAFALPTKKGQNLIIEDGNNNEIIWKVMMPMAVFGLKTPFICYYF
jgi:hypothetical protein